MTADDGDGLHDEMEPGKAEISNVRRVSCQLYLHWPELPTLDQELNDQHETSLGRAKRRDPDNQPFQTPVLNVLRYVDRLFDIFSKTEFLFAVKAGLLTILVAMPAYFPTTAG